MNNNIYCSRECRDKVKFTQDRFKKRLRRKARLQMAGDIITLFLGAVGAAFLLWLAVSLFWVIAINMSDSPTYPDWNAFKFLAGGEL